MPIGQRRLHAALRQAPIALLLRSVLPEHVLEGPVHPLGAVDEQFFSTSSSKQLLLLSGCAGSGKSTFVKELELFIQTSYAARREQADGVEVVLVKVSLPTLRNPLSNLVDEALRQMASRERSELLFGLHLL